MYEKQSKCLNVDWRLQYKAFYYINENLSFWVMFIAVYFICVYVNVVAGYKGDGNQSPWFIIAVKIQFGCVSLLAVAGTARVSGISATLIS